MTFETKRPCSDRAIPGILRGLTPGCFSEGSCLSNILNYPSLDRREESTLTDGPALTKPTRRAQSRLSSSFKRIALYNHSSLFLFRKKAFDSLNKEDYYTKNMGLRSACQKKNSYLTPQSGFHPTHDSMRLGSELRVSSVRGSFLGRRLVSEFAGRERQEMQALVPSPIIHS